jgi:hypothetical protein
MAGSRPDTLARRYAMTLDDRLWTLTRESPDFGPLDFARRFTGTFSAAGNTISGAWQKRLDGNGDWQAARLRPHLPQGWLT